MTIKNEVLIRVYVLLFLVVVVAVVIFAKAIRIGVVEGDKWREQGKKRYVQIRKIEADRGNILASDGSLLATSLPFFDVAFDPNSSGMTKADFANNIDSLAYCIATFVDSRYTPGAYRDYLVEKRNNGSQYVPIKRDVSFAEMQQIRKFPLFNKGQFRGGLIATPKYKRDRPFGLLAHRTVGYVRENIKPVGLEGFFNPVLRGEPGKQLMVRVEEEVWKPLEDLAKIEPKSGKDLKTTIDIDIQDAAEEALYKAVSRHQADYGVAIVMDVSTGAVRAIANLGRTKNGELWETYNHAIGSATEPGSTFKLATMMALLESGVVDLTDSVDLELGATTFYEEDMQDASSHQLEMTTVQNAFEISSNVGMAKLVYQNFGETKKAEQFIELMKSFHLHLKTGIKIEGEASPLIKDPNNSESGWSGTTLPWMAIGYETTITPLQLLTFYNAVANGGMMMQPYLVSEIQEYGEKIERFPPTVIKRRLASKETIEKLQLLLEGVVERGTASKHNDSPYAFAGKTGTAQLNYQRLKNSTKVGGYQASFAGYFPAEKPRYSCIVLISNPRSGAIYGGDVALPVFREITDRIYNLKMDLRTALNEFPQPPMSANMLPDKNVGHRGEFVKLLEDMEIRYENRSNYPIAVLDAQSDTIHLLKRTIPGDRIPNVVGMGLRDALFVLENLGLEVELRGYGKVVRQSIKPGTPVRGQSILLTLR
jgi:cell division protein FtsI (penicillin-binding protein 3)